MTFKLFCIVMDTLVSTSAIIKSNSALVLLIIGKLRGKMRGYSQHY